ncbi:MAG: amino acid ABC transporter permease [Rhodobiaceae bacterium]|nr:amino acid ABC transporter permease [Rhodobiaceae bacterium]MCC0047941.1 amino acid ABC transporter permease [Rhodobiaceae bacterium]
MAVQDTMGQAPAKASFIYDPKVRGVFYQIVLVAAIVWLGWEFITNAARNLEEQNISAGFGFMSNTAGFGITQSLVSYSEESSYGWAIYVGFLNTILVAFLGIIFATVIGFVVGIARLSNNWVISRIAYVYIEVLRNIPLLLQIFFWYFAVLRAVPNPRNSVEMLGGMFLNNRGLFMPRPVFGEGSILILIGLIVGIVGAVLISNWARKRQMATGQQFPSFRVGLALIVGLPFLGYLLSGMPVTFDHPELKGFNFVGGMKVIPEFMALLLALSIYTATFIAEIVRAGILAVSHGQTEAAHALGIRPGPTLRLVVIPQAMRVIIPPLTSQYLNLTKNSSLAVAIAYPDLVSVGGTVLNQTGQAIEIIGIWMLVYLSLSLLTSGFMNWYNDRMSLVER